MYSISASRQKHTTASHSIHLDPRAHDRQRTVHRRRQPTHPQEHVLFISAAQSDVLSGSVAAHATAALHVMVLPAVSLMTENVKIPCPAVCLVSPWSCASPPHRCCCCVTIHGKGQWFPTAHSQCCQTRQGRDAARRTFRHRGGFPVVVEARLCRSLSCFQSAQ